MLTNREKSDIEVLYRLFEIESILYVEDMDIFIARQNGKQRSSFLEIYPSDFPSLSKKSYHDILELLRSG